MGYYIQTPTNRQKAKQIVTQYDGRIIECPKEFKDIPEDKALICVVDNGIFEAAGFCYDEREFEAFKVPDSRERWWVLMDREEAIKLSNYKEQNHG